MLSSDNPVPAERRGVRALGRPTLSGTTLALLFWWQALTPTLIPRSWAVQAVICAICLAIGYGIGALSGRWACRLLGLRGPARSPVTRRRGWIVLGAGWLVGALVGAALWLGWQNEQRTLMGIIPVGWLDAALMVAVSAVVGALLVVIGRTVAYGVGVVNRCSHRLVPSLLATPVTVLLIVAPVIVLGWASFGTLAALATSHYASVDETTQEGIVAPTSSSVSGSGDSLVAWDTLGRWGRYFVATATPAHDLKAFHGADAPLADPVRVFVGVRSANSAASRAALAVRELERAGGFEHHVLVVWIPTGSGWMVPEAMTAIEQLHRGDTAIVGLQYSYLPSLISVFVDDGLAIEAGAALFHAVHAHWSALPADRRPKLIVSGKSLGTAGVEAPFVGIDASSSVGNLLAQTDGALIVGAKYTNPIHSQLSRERDSGSPVWQPIFDGGRSVRFVNRDPRQPAPSPDWPAPRIVYLQHPSDPVTFWGVAALWWPPAWMDQPRGFDVPPGARWFPIVSGVQAVADLLDQLGPPPGFGHVYTQDYVDGWARVAPPDGWTAADTERLEQFLTDGGGGESEP